MAIRIVVGGPPHSGKSTFTARLARTFLKEFGDDVDKMNLDPWDRSLEVISEIITEEERKQDIKNPEKILREKASEFKKRSKNHKAIIGDLPGRPEAPAEIVAKTGRYGIIVCKDDELNKIKDWKKFFEKNGVELVAVIHTSKNGKEERVYREDLIRAELVNLDKSIEITLGIKSLASLLKNRLGI